MGTFLEQSEGFRGACEQQQVWLAWLRSLDLCSLPGVRLHDGLLPEQHD